jgi:hypothetical protein
MMSFGLILFAFGITAFIVSLGSWLVQRKWTGITWKTVKVFFYSLFLVVLYLAAFPFVLLYGTLFKWPKIGLALSPLVVLCALILLYMSQS